MATAPSIKLDTLVVKRPDFSGDKVEGKEKATIKENGQAYSCSKVASDLLALLVKPRRVSELCDELEQKYEVERRCIELDVLSCLNHLCEEDLLELTDVTAQHN